MLLSLWDGTRGGVGVDVEFWDFGKIEDVAKEVKKELRDALARFLCSEKNVKDRFVKNRDTLEILQFVKFHKIVESKWKKCQENLPNSLS